MGIRKTLPVLPSKVWDFLFSGEGLEIWLGKISTGQFDLNKSFKTSTGAEGKINIFKPNSHIRLTWKPKHWTNTSTLQIRIIAIKDKTTVSFHQEKLLDSNQREEMKNYWGNIVNVLAEKLKAIR